MRRHRANLHGFTAVAELKLFTPSAMAEAQGYLHGFTAVAELKPIRAIDKLRDEADISTASPPWPN